MMHSWAFAQLGRFLVYRAHAAGVAFVQADPSHTSQTCSPCGWVETKETGSRRASLSVGGARFVGHADHNAAINIAMRGVERWGEVMRRYAARTQAAS